MSKYFAFTKIDFREAITTKAEAPKTPEQIQSALERSPAVKAFAAQHKPSSNLRYEMPFRDMVDVTFLSYPKSGQTADGLDRAWKHNISRLGGYVYIPGSVVPMQDGVSVMGEYNLRLIKKYDEAVFKKTGIRPEKVAKK